VAGLALRVGRGVDPVVEMEQAAEGGERLVVARLAVLLEDPVGIRDGTRLECPVIAAEDRDQQEQRQDAGEPDQPASPDARAVDLPRDFDVISTRNVLKATLVRHCPNPVQNMSEGRGRQRRGHGSGRSAGATVFRSQFPRGKSGNDSRPDASSARGRGAVDGAPQIALAAIVEVTIA